MKLKVNRYCISYTMGTIKYGLIKYKRVFVLCYNCLIDFKWVNVIYALCIMRTHTHTGIPRYSYNVPSTYLLFLRCCVLFAYILVIFYTSLAEMMIIIIICVYNFFSSLPRRVVRHAVIIILCVSINHEIN